MDTLLAIPFIILAFLSGMTVFPIMRYIRIYRHHRLIKKSKSLKDALKIIFPKDPICPFGAACLTYDEKGTKEALDRVIKLMKENINNDTPS